MGTTTISKCVEGSYRARMDPTKNHVGQSVLSEGEYENSKLCKYLFVAKVIVRCSSPGRQEHTGACLDCGGGLTQAAAAAAILAQAHEIEPG